MRAGSLQAQVGLTPRGEMLFGSHHPWGGGRYLETGHRRRADGAFQPSSLHQGVEQRTTSVGDAQPARSGGLRIQVDDQRRATCLCERGREVQCRGRLTRAALVIHRRQRTHGANLDDGDVGANVPGWRYQNDGNLGQTGALH